MFTIDSGNQGTIYLPTLYLLFQLEKLPALRVFLKEGVEQYIFNGADLMWPGIKSLNTEDFRQYDVAVIYAKNAIPSPDLQVTYVPIAVGRILASKMPEELKGKAVQVEHFLYDELWNSGPKKIPDEIRMIAKDADGDKGEEEVKFEEVKESSEIKTEGEEQLVEQEENKAGEIVTEVI